MKSRKKFHILRVKKVSEERQGLIFYICRCYPDLPDAKKKILDELFERVGGAHADALREVMTTDDSFNKICLKHYIASHTTLTRLRARFFEEFPLEEMMS